ncbi:hypothetical protein MHYP_G00074280 [Metynnis hypsauchen]
MTTWSDEETLTCSAVEPFWTMMTTHEPVCTSTRRPSPPCGCQNRSGAGSVSLGRNKRLPESVTFNRFCSAGTAPEDPAPNGSPGFCSVCEEPGAQNVL